MSTEITVIHNTHFRYEGDTEAHAGNCSDVNKKLKCRDKINEFTVSSTAEDNDERDVWIRDNLEFLEEYGADAASDVKFFPCCHKSGLIKNDDRSWYK